MTESAPDQTKRVLLRAALVAQSAGEPTVAAHRVAAALLRTPIAADFCARSKLGAMQVLTAADDPGAPSFDSCERVADDQSAISLQPRPLDEHAKGAFDAVLNHYGQIAVPPLHLLLQIIRADRDVASRLAAHGVSAEAISIELAKEPK